MVGNVSPSSQAPRAILPARPIDQDPWEKGKESQKIKNAPPAAASEEKSAAGLGNGEILFAKRLQNIDASVRAHEQAHLAAVAVYAQGPVQYSYVMADGRLYAVGGSIAVDLNPVPGDPEATLRKARALIRSAYSPMSPSDADMRVAAAAYRLEMQAKREIRQEKEREEEAVAGVSVYA